MFVYRSSRVAKLAIFRLISRHSMAESRLQCGCLSRRTTTSKPGTGASWGPVKRCCIQYASLNVLYAQAGSCAFTARLKYLEWVTFRMRLMRPSMRYPAICAANT